MHWRAPQNLSPFSFQVWRTPTGFSTTARLFDSMSSSVRDENSSMTCPCRRFSLNSACSSSFFVESIVIIWFNSLPPIPQVRKTIITQTRTDRRIAGYVLNAMKPTKAMIMRRTQEVMKSAHHSPFAASLTSKNDEEEWSFLSPWTLTLEKITIPNLGTRYVNLFCQMSHNSHMISFFIDWPHAIIWISTQCKQISVGISSKSNRC